MDGVDSARNAKLYQSRSVSDSAAMRREFAYRGVIANKENRRDTRASPPPPSLPMLRRTVWHEVRHHRQRYAWDCGLACVQMVLPEQHARQLETNFHSICQDEGIAKR